MTMNDTGENDKAVDRALRRLRRYDKESRFLVKRSEDYKVLEEVFDRPTLLTLHNMINSKEVKYLNGVISSGKEARVYWGVREDNSDVAVKIYLTVTAEFRRRLPYIIGDPRFKKVKRGIRNLVNLWARKEYQNLKTGKNAGVPCPAPQAVSNNVLVMEFIGKEGRPAPLLSEIKVDKQDYLQTLSIIRTLLKDAQLVHADLSEYNIFKHNSQLIFFDFGSAVNLRHPKAKDFLIRDITNINRFFKRRDVDVFSTEETLMLMKGNDF